MAELAGWDTGTQLQDTVEDDPSKVMHKILTRKAMFVL